MHFTSTAQSYEENITSISLAQQTKNNVQPVLKKNKKNSQIEIYISKQD